MTDLERAEALRDVLAGCPFAEWKERIASYFADACAEQQISTSTRRTANMTNLDRAAAIALARNILANVPDSYTDEQLNDIGTRAVYWVTKLGAAEEGTPHPSLPEEEHMANCSNEPMLQFFEFGHLPEHLAAVSTPFAFLARDMVIILPRNPERTAALRKLLEAKDCAVRALIYRED
jgi:hypothetical protein